MPNLFSIIGESWSFWRKQQVAVNVTIWFLFLPMLGMSVLTDIMEDNEALLDERPELWIVAILLFIILSVTAMWGTVCTLNVGKRLLQAKSGRARTSFKTVRSQSSAVFIPYLLTTLLRTAVTLLWALLLIIPGIIYALRTAFYPVIVVCEGEAYRPALHSSINVVRGQFWQVAGTLVGLGLLVSFPASFIDEALHALVKDAPGIIVFSASVAASVVNAVSVAIYTFCMILAYGHFKPAGHVSN